MIFFQFICLDHPFPPPRYCEDQEPAPVDYPDDPGIVFDMESCVMEGNLPTMAVAASSKAWYIFLKAYVVHYMLHGSEIQNYQE